MGSFWPYATGSGQAFCALDHGEGCCGFASFAAGTIQIRNNGSLWGRFGDTLGSRWNHFCIVLLQRTRVRQPSLPWMVLCMLMTFAPNRCTASCGASSGFICPKSLFLTGLVSPLKERCIGTETSPWAFTPPPVPFPGCLFWGRALPEEQLGGYIPYSLTRGYILKAFPTTCRPNTCPLPRCGVAATLQQLPGRYSPSTSVHPAVSLSGH